MYSGNLAGIRPEKPLLERSIDVRLSSVADASETMCNRPLFFCPVKRE
jgi:hypothetical protein